MYIITPVLPYPHFIAVVALLFLLGPVRTEVQPQCLNIRQKKRDFFHSTLAFNIGQIPQPLPEPFLM